MYVHMCVCVLCAEFLFHFAIQHNIANIYVYKSLYRFSIRSTWERVI